jgi:WD40 repeat protein
MHKSLLGAACDQSVMLFNTEVLKVDHAFIGTHHGKVKGVAFSPLNKLLLCSAGDDGNICFYDMNEKVQIKTIRTDLGIASVAFCNDGHTIAVGSQDGQLAIYDLRKSANEVDKYCVGNKGAVLGL